MPTTYKGRVVYDRKEHPFVYKDVMRIMSKMSEEIDWYDIRKDENVQRVRAIFRFAQNFYSYVWDLAEDIPRKIKIEDKTYESRYFLRDQYRDFMDVAVRQIAQLVEEFGGAGAGWIVEKLGILINRGVEYIIMGD